MPFLSAQVLIWQIMRYVLAPNFNFSEIYKRYKKFFLWREALSRDINGIKYERVVSEMLPVCLWGWMHASLARESLHGLYSCMVCNGLSVSGWCSMYIVPCNSVDRQRQARQASMQQWLLSNGSDNKHVLTENWNDRTQQWWKRRFLRMPRCNTQVQLAVAVRQINAEGYSLLAVAVRS